MSLLTQYVRLLLKKDQRALVPDGRGQVATAAVDSDRVVALARRGDKRERPIPALRREVVISVLLACLAVIVMALLTGNEPAPYSVSGSAASDGTTTGPFVLPGTPHREQPWYPPAVPLVPIAQSTPIPAKSTSTPVNRDLPPSDFSATGAIGTGRTPSVTPPGPGIPAGAVALPFQEAHWQGLEVIPLTPRLGAALGIPTTAAGVITDDVTTPADMEGFQAGDLIQTVGQQPTPQLEAFIAATAQVRERRRVEVGFLRAGARRTLVLTALQGRLGTANGETAPMIRPGSQPPHRYQGQCTNCHRIGSNGQLPIDQGDLLTKTAPSIFRGQPAPHRPRGACSNCHRVIR